MPDTLLGLKSTNKKDKAPQFQRKTAFKVFSTVNQAPQVAGTIVDFTAKTYDLGANFDLVNNQYVIPYQGLYQYACMFVMSFTAAGPSTSMSLELTTQFGVEFILFGATYKNYAISDSQVAQAAGSHIFQKGDEVRLRAFGSNQFVFVGAEVAYYWSMFRVESESRTVL